jgi:hypothetical protein
VNIFLLKAFIKIRWWYFHISPNYIKFYMSSESDEAHFQHRKTGQIHSNYCIVKNP